MANKRTMRGFTYKLGYIRGEISGWHVTPVTLPSPENKYGNPSNEWIMWQLTGGSTTSTTGGARWRKLGKFAFIKSEITTLPNGKMILESIFTFTPCNGMALNALMCVKECKVRCSVNLYDGKYWYNGRPTMQWRTVSYNVREGHSAHYIPKNPQGWVTPNYKYREACIAIADRCRRSANAT